MQLRLTWDTDDGEPLEAMLLLLVKLGCHYIIERDGKTIGGGSSSSVMATGATILEKGGGGGGSSSSPTVKKRRAPV